MFIDIAYLLTAIRRPYRNGFLRLCADYLERVQQKHVLDAIGDGNGFAVRNTRQTKGLEPGI